MPKVKNDTNITVKSDLRETGKYNVSNQSLADLNISVGNDKQANPTTQVKAEPKNTVRETAKVEGRKAEIRNATTEQVRQQAQQVQQPTPQPKSQDVKASYQYKDPTLNKEHEGTITQKDERFGNHSRQEEEDRNFTVNGQVEKTQTISTDPVDFTKIKDSQRFDDNDGSASDKTISVDFKDLKKGQLVVNGQVRDLSEFSFSVSVKNSAQQRTTTAINDIIAKSAAMFVVNANFGGDSEIASVKLNKQLASKKLAEMLSVAPLAD